MAGRVAGKLALVTGAAQGLGGPQMRRIARRRLLPPSDSTRAETSMNLYTCARPTPASSYCRAAAAPAERALTSASGYGNESQ